MRQDDWYYLGEYFHSEVWAYGVPLLIAVMLAVSLSPGHTHWTDT